VSDGDAAELAQIARGDQLAFTRWLARSELRLRASLRSFATTVDVEAILQETLLRVWQVAPKVTDRDGDGDPLFRLALRVARNLAIDEVRRTGRAVLPEPQGLPEDARHLPDPWLRALVERCLAELPRQPRRAIQQRIASAGGAADASLAEEIGMRLNTFLQNVGRARSLLAKCLSRSGVHLESERP